VCETIHKINSEGRDRKGSSNRNPDKPGTFSSATAVKELSIGKQNKKKEVKDGVSHRGVYRIENCQGRKRFGCEKASDKGIQELAGKSG
jgi:hypothetical protein